MKLNVAVWFDTAIKINKYYTCPEKCGMCCKANRIVFSRQEYYSVLAKLEPDKRDAFRANVIESPDVFEDMIKKGYPRTIAIKESQKGQREFKSRLCPMLVENKCSINSFKFRTCKEYPFIIDYSHIRECRGLVISSCPMGLDITYDFVGFGIFNAYHVDGLDTLAYITGILNTALNCYKERLITERITSENLEDVITYRFAISDAAENLRYFLDYLIKCHENALPLLHSIRELIKQTIESCADEIDELTALNFMEQWQKRIILLGIDREG